MRHLSMATLTAGLLMLVMISAGRLAQESKSPVDSTKGGMGMMNDMPQAMKLKAQMMMKKMKAKRKKKSGSSENGGFGFVQSSRSCPSQTGGVRQSGTSVLSGGIPAKLEIFHPSRRF